ncbi:ABC transporter permease [Actinoplanes sp. NBRC 14428]|uniref:NitT/TauT family transport system permease protein n=1 Tax=Pseudosporangium ferrugineum TaxID=439699 RepID=A0A2T0RLH7_9ACTN|nr:ABC transporter permease [Pseudosporangium ferrugineum]PRY22049.1 NitT/TauT family transport system permease protein [Pseudosporangium ferrugineum]BCJ50674.1 ABC transporter permease [Actinoplanes sp. NBRC 14428]
MTDTGTRGTRARLWKNTALPLIGAVLAVALWWLLTAALHVDPFYVPSPPDVVRSFLRTPEFLLDETWVTLQRVLIGFVIATAGGLVIAVVLAASETVERMTMPLLAAINAVPKVALAPLLLVWMGFGDSPKIVMVVLVSFFPVIVSTMAGLSSTPGDLRELARSLSASWWQTFVKVRLTWALPQVFVGLKVASPLAIIGAVIGEVVNPDHGLGSVIVNSGASSDTPQAFAALALLAVTGVGLFYLMAALERITVPWARAIS